MPSATEDGLLLEMRKTEFVFGIKDREFGLGLEVVPAQLETWRNELVRPSPGFTASSSHSS